MQILITITTARLSCACVNVISINIVVVVVIQSGSHSQVPTNYIIKEAAKMVHLITSFVTRPLIDRIPKKVMQ